VPVFGTPSDLELVERIRDGDMSAKEALYRRSLPGTSMGENARMNDDEAAALLARCDDHRLRVLRGDGILGITSVDEIAQMVAGCE
jgi:hypothetical protein